jgi:shikimate kinase
MKAEKGINQNTHVIFLGGSIVITPESRARILQHIITK